MASSERLIVVVNQAAFGEDGVMFYLEVCEDFHSLTNQKIWEERDTSLPTRHLNLMKCFVIILAVVTTSLASAELTDYSTDFTSASGFSDAATANDNDGWAMRTEHITSATDSYGALEMNSNGGAMTHLASGGSLEVGESVTLSAGVFYTGNTQNNRLRIGIKESPSVTGLPDAGVEFNMDATLDGNFDIDGIASGGANDFGPVIDSELDAVFGQENGETFIVTITKSATPNEFDLDWSLRNGASSGSFMVTHEGLYAAATVYATMTYNGPTGGETQVDSFSIENGEGGGGVDPDPVTEPVLREVVFDRVDVTLTWDSSPGRVYAVEASRDLTSDSWTAFELSDGVVSGGASTTFVWPDGDEAPVIDPAVEGSLFFRVIDVGTAP